MKKIATIFAGVLMALSFTSVANAQGAGSGGLCNVDHKCGVWWYEEAHTTDQCNRFRDYCMDMNACWADGNVFKAAAAHYRDNTIMPGYEHCIATATDR